MRGIIPLCFGLAVLCLAPPLAISQDSTRPTPAVAKFPNNKKPIETQVTIELLTGPEGVTFRAQKWTALMQELDLPLRIRRGFGDENQTGLVEKKIGTSLREIHIIGRIDPDATIYVDNRSFRLHDAAKFREWIKELKTYGTQGTPKGKPIWGLSLKQFEEIFAALAEPVEKPVVGFPLSMVLTDLKLPRQYPLVIDESAKSVLMSNTELGVVTDVREFSHGVALAILLKERGLGFFPRRTPEGTIELAVADLAERDDVWPTGWPPQGNQYELIPGLTTLTDIHTVDQPLLEFMENISQLSQLKIVYDRYAIHRDKIDLDAARINLPEKRLTWITGLRAALFKHRLRPEIVTDEGGRPYLWITSEKLKPLLPFPKE